MAKRFKPVDRDQQFLLPVDMREWLPPDHLVWFVLDVVESLDTAPFVGRYRLGGAGREAFDPSMMIALLVYAYAGGMRSSRAIERACHTDVAFRVICAQRVPDHTVIARFRAGHEAALAELFGQVLVLCARAGLGQVGVVAIDGTKIAANASLDWSRQEDWFRKQAAAILADADAVDAVEDGAETAGGGEDGMDPEWRDRTGRKERIRRALAELEARNIERQQPVVEAERRAAAAQRDYDLLRADRQARIDSDDRVGRPINPDLEPRKLASARRRAERRARFVETLRQRIADGPPVRANLTDPQSRMMKARQGWVQGYNCQTAVSEDGIIMVAEATVEPIDMSLFVPVVNQATDAITMINDATGESRQIGLVVADAGYFSEDNLKAAGPERLIAVGKRRNIADDDRATGARRPLSSKNKHACDAMVDKLRQPANARLYKKRAALVEPVNAHIKDRRGLRTFARRGLAAVNAEFRFAAWVTNLMHLYNTQTATA